jgi:PhnB protein
MIGKPRREGFHTVTPYLMVRHVEPVLEFMAAAFDAAETYRASGAGRGIHLEVQIGDSRIMIGGDTPGGNEPAPVSLFLYVEDVDAVWKRAIEAGAESTIEPGANFGESRGAGVVDPFGNQWFIATHKE